MKTASWYYSFATDPLDQLKCVLSLDKIALLLKGFLSFLLSTDGNAIQGVGYSHFIVMYTYCQKTIIRSLSYNSVSSQKMKVFTLLLMVLVSVKYVVTLMLPPNLTRISSRENKFQNFSVFIKVRYEIHF